MALTNNDIFKKLRVALQLRDDDIIEILSLVEFNVSKSELGAFFRKDDHPKYMPVQDQLLRNFLNGLIIYKRGPAQKKPTLLERIKYDDPEKQAEVAQKRPIAKRTGPRATTPKPLSERIVRKEESDGDGDGDGDGEPREKRKRL